MFNDEPKSDKRRSSADAGSFVFIIVGTQKKRDWFDVSGKIDIYANFALSLALAPLVSGRPWPPLSLIIN